MKKLAAIIVLLGLTWVASSGARDDVGFFLTGEVDARVVREFQVSHLLVSTPAQVQHSLRVASANGHRISLDFSPALTARRESLSINYETSSGEELSKHFRPLADHHVRRMRDMAGISDALAPYLPSLRRYHNTVADVFIADEPYLNGISRGELEQGVAHVRAWLDLHRMRRIGIGVVFASGMFNAQFARHIDRAAGDYVRGIDRYYEDHGEDKEDAFAAWLSIIESRRLTTYDMAGNMYIGGGLPKGIDVVGFDFYLSTILQDGLYDRTIDVLKSKSPEACGGLGGSIKEILKGVAWPTKDVLDALFRCRMVAATSMLLAEMTTNRPRVLLIGQASSTGLEDINWHGDPLPQQNKRDLISRTVDEVRRTAALYRDCRPIFNGGAMHFLYDDTVDQSINLPLAGAQSEPEIMDAARATGGDKHQCPIRAEH